MNIGESLGKFNHEVLENGLNIFVQKVTTSPVVSMHFAVSTGSMHENPAGHGLSHFLEHMIFKGSKLYPNKSDIADTVQAAGGHINAYTTKDHTNYYIDSLSDCWEEMLTVLTDAVVNPLFPEDEFIPEKEVILREQSMYEDNPNYHLQQTTYQALLENHPFGLPVIGFKDKIKEVNRELMVDYYNRRYQPINSTIVIIGDVEPIEVIEKIKVLLNSWPNNLIEPLVIPPFFAKSCFSETDLFFDDNQARLSISYKLPTGVQEDIPTLDVIETMLSGSSSALMISELKTKEELAVSVGAFSYTIAHAGIFMCSGATTPAKLRKLEKGIFALLERLCNGEFSDKDIERAILKDRISFIKQLQTVSSRAQLFMGAIIDFSSPNYWDNYLTALQQVDREAIQRVAKKYFISSQATVVRQWPTECRVEVQKLQNSKDESLGSVSAKKSILPKSKVRFIEFNQSSEPMISIGVLFPYGSFIDPIDKKGTALLLCRMLSTGSGGLSEEEFANKLDDNGITFSFSPGNNTMRCQISFLAEKTDVALEILSDTLLRPNLSEKIFEREKHNILERLKSKERKVFAPASKAFAEAMFGKSHPYCSGTDGHSSTVENINIDDLKQILPCFYDKSQVIVNTTGDFSNGSNLSEKIDKIITKLPYSKLQNPLPAEPTFDSESCDIKINSTKEQAIAIVGVPGVKASSKKRHTLEILLSSLNGQSSRIFKSVREEKGLAYDTGMVARLGIHPGYIGLYAVVDPIQADEAMTVLKDELDKLADAALTFDEFETAKLNIVSERAFEAQSAKAIATVTAINEYYGVSFQTSAEELNEIKLMNYDDFCKQTKTIFSHPCRVSVIVGDQGTINHKKAE